MVESCVTFFPVNDIEETTRFYRDLLGLSLWKDMGNCRIFDCGRGYFGFCNYGDGRELPKGICLSLNMADTAAVDRQYELLVKNGAPVSAPPQKHSSFPVYSFFLKDPSGYMVEFQKILA